MTYGEYAEHPGLHFSAMKDLEVSPLRYWWHHLRPDREPEEPTDELEFGTAVHTAVLEPAEFDKRYACTFQPPADVLDTVKQLEAFMVANGRKMKGKLKADVIAQVLAEFPQAPILDVLEAEYVLQHPSKAFFKPEAWKRITGCAEALHNEPAFAQLMEQGESEVAMFGTDMETGVPLKARMDWVTPKATLDIKTFTQQRGRDIDECVNNAIWYEKYHRQGYIYTTLRAKVRNEDQKDYILAFVESDEPHETRLKVLRPKLSGQANLYWTRAMLDVRGFCRLYRDCMNEFGPDRPWRRKQDVDVLLDDDLPGLAFGR